MENTAQRVKAPLAGALTHLWWGILPHRGAELGRESATVEGADRCDRQCGSTVSDPAGGSGV